MKIPLPDNGINEAEMLYNIGEYDQAFLKYQALADQGYVECQVFLGWLYQQGLGTTQDYKYALEYYSKAAQQGANEGQFRLAKIYAKNKDYKKAYEWYKKSADGSYSPALFRLGWIYNIGRGTSVNKDKAYNYFERASNLGHVFAQKEMALLLINGYRGKIYRLIGVYLYIKVLFVGLYVGIKYPHSEHILD